MHPMQVLGKNVSFPLLGFLWLLAFFGVLWLVVVSPQSLPPSSRSFFPISLCPFFLWGYQSLYFSPVQSLSRVWVFATSWTIACQASLSITNSWTLAKLMSIELMMPSNHLILCCPLLLLPSIFPNIRVFSNESALRIWWPNYWSFSFNISPSNEHPGLIFFRMDWLDPLAFRTTLIHYTLFFANSICKDPVSKKVTFWGSRWIQIWGKTVFNHYWFQVAEFGNRQTKFCTSWRQAWSFTSPTSSTGHRTVFLKCCLKSVRLCSTAERQKQPRCP